MNNIPEGVSQISGRAGMSRLGFLAAAGAGALTLAGCGGSSGSGSASSGSTTAAQTAATGGELNLWTWASYWAPKNLKLFTEKTGTKIHQANYDSNDQMFAKMNSAAVSSYDMAIPTSGWIPLLAQRNTLAELDTSGLPLQYVDAQLKNQNYDPQGKYSVPKDYGVLGVIYDPAAVPGTVTSWNDYLELGAKLGVSGKVACSNTADECIGIGMWSLGLDWNSKNQDDIKRGAEVMKDFAPHVKSFIAYPIDGVVSGEFAMGVLSHGDARRARLQKPSLKFVVPTPSSEIWVDSYVITKDAPDPGQAYSFISFMLQPDQQVRDTSYIGYPTPLPGLEAKLPASVPLKDDIFVSPEVLSRVTSRITDPSTQGLIASEYNQIAGAA